MSIRDFILRFGWKLYRMTHGEYRSFWDLSRVEYKGQQANDLVREAIINAKDGLMVSKFGTIELNAVCSCKRYKDGFKISDYMDYMDYMDYIFSILLFQFLGIHYDLSYNFVSL